MIGYAELEIFTAPELYLLREAIALVNHVPYLHPDGYPFRCHELARAVGLYLGLPHVDGKFLSTQHTWLVTMATPSSYHVLDVYVPGAVPQVQLIDIGHFPWAGRGYAPGRDRDDIRHQDVSHLTALFWKESPKDGPSGSTTIGRFSCTCRELDHAPWCATHRRTTK